MGPKLSLLLNILDKTKMLFKTAHIQDDLRPILETFSKEVEQLEKMLQREQRFSLAFVGMTNVGKSTLLNALLGAVVAPIKNCPWSSTAVEYRYSPQQYEMIVPQPNTLLSLHQDFDTQEKLLEALNLFAVQGGAFQTSNPLVVKIPSSLLTEEVTIVDTPGFGAANGAGGQGLHDDILKKYIEDPKRQLRIFWIVKDNISASALDFFQTHLASMCTDLVVNMTDDMDEEMRRQFEALYRPKVGYTIRFHYLDAKSAMRGNQKGDMEQVERSGILPFKKYLQSFTSLEQRAYVVRENLSQLFVNLHDSLYEIHGLPLGARIWLPTRWGQLQIMLRQVDDNALLTAFQTI